MFLPFLDFLDTWNQAIHALLCLAPCTQNNNVRLHPCGTHVNRYLIPLSCQRAFPSRVLHALFLLSLFFKSITICTRLSIGSNFYILFKWRKRERTPWGTWEKDEQAFQGHQLPWKGCGKVAIWGGRHNSFRCRWPSLCLSFLSCKMGLGKKGH